MLKPADSNFFYSLNNEGQKKWVNSGYYGGNIPGMPLSRDRDFALREIIIEHPQAELRHLTRTGARNLPG
jgi:hypothetical protein